MQFLRYELESIAIQVPFPFMGQMLERTKDRRRILFYDDECGLCTHSVRFFMKRDHAQLIQYAPLQGETAKKYLPEDLRDASALSSVVYFVGDEWLPCLHTRSDAIATALIDLSGIWRLAGWALGCIPFSIREAGYKFIAKHRLKIFPKGACALPTQEERARLLP